MLNRFTISEDIPSRIDRQEILEPTVPWAPPPIPSWYNVLALVNLESLYRRPTSPTWRHDRCLPFPKPLSFYTIEPPEFFVRIETWKAIQPAWLASVANGRSTVMNAQEWKTVLRIPFDGGVPGGDDLQTLKDAAKYACWKAVRERCWHEGIPRPHIHDILARAMLRTNETDLTTERSTMWALHELNFKYELLSLDRRIAEGPIQGQDARLYWLQREAAVLSCFYGGDTGETLICTADPSYARSGLADSDWQERKTYVRNMIVLMQAWGVYCPGELRAGGDWTNIPLFVFQRMERRMIEGYCQAFYFNFSRLPTLPRTL